MTFTSQDWQIIPDPVQPNRFELRETKTDKLLGTISLPEDGNINALNLIEAAPELQDIAEMYRDHMIGTNMQKTMVYSMTIQTLERAEQAHEVEALECA